MQLQLEIALLILSTLAFLLTVRGLLRTPFREQRVATLAGGLVSVGFASCRRVAYDPERWSMQLNPWPMRLSSLILCTLTLVLVAAAYQALRRRSRRPLLVGLLGVLPGMAAVCALLVGEAMAQGMNLKTAVLELQYDALLAAGAFVAPLLVFELLMRTELWNELPSEPPVR